jgi:hypothetical protein
MPPDTEYHDPYDDGNEDPDDPRNFGDRWQSDEVPDSPPKLPAIPRDVLLWYPTAVTKWLSTELFTKDAGLGWLAKFQKWYQDRSAEFLLLEPALEGYSMWGGWRLNEQAMYDAVPRADADLGWTEPEEAKEPPEARAPVGPATEADVDAALARMRNTRPPEENYTAFVLHRSGGDTDPAIGRWRETRRRIKAKTPIPCRCCGEFFLTGQQFANCPGCRSAGRKRCLDCNEVFSPAHNKIKRCEGCLAREAEWKANRKRH